MPEPAVMLEERAATSGDLDKLEEHADRNLVEVNRYKPRSCTWEGWAPCSGASWDWLEGAALLRSPWAPWQTELGISQQSALAAKRANNILGCVTRCGVGRWKKLIIPYFLSTQWTPSRVSCLVLDPHKRQDDKLEWAENPLHGQGLSILTLEGLKDEASFSLGQRKLLRGTSEHLKGGQQEHKTGLFTVGMVGGQDTLGKSENTLSLDRMQGNHFPVKIVRY